MSDGMNEWQIAPGKIQAFDMIVPAAEVTVAPELAMRAIDYLADVLEDEGQPHALRVQAASAIITHHAHRKYAS